MSTNPYEAARLARIAENRKRMEAIGIPVAVEALRQTAAAAPPRRRKRRDTVNHQPLRRSSRLNTAKDLDDAVFATWDLEHPELTLCHYCRQRTSRQHVTCTARDCGGPGGRLAVSFCGKCLSNRHGEDVKTAAESGTWICPLCRGGCGPGCDLCCTCSICRSRAGLAPTHQMVHAARDAGFDNVHDFLIHVKTGETAAEIAQRKRRW